MNHLFYYFLSSRLASFSNRIYLKFGIAILSVFLVLPAFAKASTLVIVSDRSASTMVSGAHLFLDNHTGKTISVRTVSQINALKQKDFSRLLNQHDTLLVLSVFGELVDRLVNYPFNSKQTRFMMQGDRRLLPLNSIHGQSLFSDLSDQNKQLVLGALEENSEADIRFQNWLRDNPVYQTWFQARRYWQNRHIENAASLLALLYEPLVPKKLKELAPIRLFNHTTAKSESLDKSFVSPEQFSIDSTDQRPIVWILDHDTGDRQSDWQLHKELCRLGPWQCISVLASWGEPSVEAIRYIQTTMSSASRSKISWLIVSLQDFVVGGGDGREAVADIFSDLNVPILKGIRLTDRTQAQWLLSSEGLPTDSVHYRVAMPELQGLGQASILSIASEKQVDALTGARLIQNTLLSDELTEFSSRINHWLSLQDKSNAEKKIAIIYYNHPPGRHNIGADNLNVPNSLFEILKRLESEGYNTGTLPDSAEALLDLLQAKGVNLPNDQHALATSAGELRPLSLKVYQDWFQTLPKIIQEEMIFGPIAQLHQTIKEQFTLIDNLALGDARALQLDTLQAVIDNSLNDLHHALDGVRHKGRLRALDLLDQLIHEYTNLVMQKRENKAIDWLSSDQLSKALIDMKVEGLRGWGVPPGDVMTWQDQFVIPGLRFGNVFLGPQPPRGWELNEELLHANMSFPPTHQYLAFYLYLREEFGADALVHVGRHSTYEFLPKRSVGLGATDYPGKLIGPLPSIYPYIVDGVGEGIQAKRRGSAIMIDHLTPPLAITELYDDLLVLRQLIESAEAASDKHTQSRAVKALRQKIADLNLKDELEASMDEELEVRGVGFDQIDDEFLLHEVGHYLTNIQEQFMPLGLHTFGLAWQPSAVETMLSSMSQGENNDQNTADMLSWRNNLIASPKHESDALINALAGGFIAPGKGNDPIRTPDALPTGRNFYALDSGLLPSRLGYDLGYDIALKADLSKTTISADSAIVPEKLNDSQPSDKQAIILWASDAVRDEGAMIGFGMALLGVRPIWNSRGIVKGLERLPLDETLGKRHDVLFTTSGLFRDLYGKQIHLLDKSVLMALDASADLIEERFPILRIALRAALEPLGEMRQGGYEPLSHNRVASNWLAEAQSMLALQTDSNMGQLEFEKLSLEKVGRQASLRIFGTAPGAYGAGINRLVERSGSWDDRKELGQVYIKRMGHAYGVNVQGESATSLFRNQLSSVSQTYLGRASNLYGLLDNNDAFDYLGGLNMAIETVTGSTPKSAVIQHADANNIKVDTLPVALLSELRGRFLNKQWIVPLMDEGYSGARTMGSEFIEYLWGWQVTSPDIINANVWESVKAVYIDDAQNLGLAKFLSEGHNRYVQTNILAVMLTAINKGFWQADEKTIAQLAEQFAQNIVDHGIPGSGHTHANHPVYDFVKMKVNTSLVDELEQVLSASRLLKSSDEISLTHVQEIQFDEQVSTPKETQADQSENVMEEQLHSSNNTFIVIILFIITLVGIGIWRGRNLR